MPNPGIERCILLALWSLYPLRPSVALLLAVIRACAEPTALSGILRPRSECWGNAGP
jgi:hypothetical protein